MRHASNNNFIELNFKKKIKKSQRANNYLGSLIILWGKYIGNNTFWDKKNWQIVFFLCYLE